MFTGKKRLVFGVEIFELEYSPVNKRFRMKLVEEAFKIRKPGQEKDHKVLKPVLIENKEDDEGFMISE